MNSSGSGHDLGQGDSLYPDIPSKGLTLFPTAGGNTSFDMKGDLSTTS